ncbi:MAG: hypothetical protein OEM02_06800 [Desulfobulbaceae bacterium]|nr:hypothetical protein [Desulfobulbaceae bacterium]
MKRLLSIIFIFFVSLITIASPAKAILGKLELTELSKIADRRVPVWVYDRKSGKLLGQAEYLVEKGGWYFDFPERKSEYIAVWPGGELLVTSPSITKKEIYNYSGAAAATVLGLALAATSIGESGDSSEWSEPPPSPIPTCDELAGPYSMDGVMVSNNCDDAEEVYTKAGTVSCVSGFVVIVVSRTFDTMNGSYDEDSGTVEAAGTSKDESTAFAFQGTAKKNISNLNDISISGMLTVRPPENCQTVYDVKYQRN